MKITKLINMYRYVWYEYGMKIDYINHKSFNYFTFLILIYRITI